MKGKRYSRELEDDAVRHWIKSGKTADEVARSLGVTTWSLRRWKAEALKAMDAFQRARAMTGSGQGSREGPGRRESVHRVLQAGIMGGGCPLGASPRRAGGRLSISARSLDILPLSVHLANRAPWGSSSK